MGKVRSKNRAQLRAQNDTKWACYDGLLWFSQDRRGATQTQTLKRSSQSASFPFSTSVRNHCVTIQHSSYQTGPTMAPSFKVVRLGSKQNDKHPLLQHLAHSRAFLAMTPINRKKLGKSIASSKWAITVAVNQLIWHEVTHGFHVEMILISRMWAVLCLIEYSLHLIQPTQRWELPVWIFCKCLKKCLKLFCHTLSALASSKLSKASAHKQQGSGRRMGGKSGSAATSTSIPYNAKLSKLAKLEA